jgi:pimeloyl-ACP methyl ester carboxylesterase
MFNKTAAINEQLVRGGEDIFFGNEFALLPRRNFRSTPSSTTSTSSLQTQTPCVPTSTGTARLTPPAQNEQRKAHRLTMPVLAIGGEKSAGETPANTMKLTADDVQGVVIPGSGHWVAEEEPDELLSAMTPFLAPYRDAHAMPNRAVAT